LLTSPSFHDIVISNAGSEREYSVGANSSGRLIAMEEIGIVERVKENGYAVVRAGNRALCEFAEREAGYPDFKEECERVITAINRGGAKVGDQVLMSMNSGTFLKAALIVYLIPVFALFFGAILGEVCSARIWCSENPGSCAALFGLICFGLSYGVVRLLNGRGSRSRNYYPVIERVVEFPDVSFPRESG